MIRVRLKFESTPVSYAQKCWFTFDGEKCRLVSDVSHLLAAHFGIKNAHGIQLYMNEYLVPTNESARVFRDNDAIEVRMVPRPLGSSTSTESTSSSNEEEESVIIPQSMPKRKKVQRKGAENGSKKGTVGNNFPSLDPVPSTSLVAKKLVGVTKKLATGGMHTKFHGSSSSSSGSGSGSDPSSDNQTVAARRRQGSGVLSKTQWDVKEAVKEVVSRARIRKQGNGVPSRSKTRRDVKEATSQAKTAGVANSLKTTPVAAKKTTPYKKGATPLSEKKGAMPLSEKKGVACNGGLRGTKETMEEKIEEVIATATRTRTKKRKGKGLKVNGKIPAVVGGVKDILTTNSCIYTSPVGKGANVKVTDAAAAALGRGDGGKEADHIGGADVQGVDGVQGDREGDVSMEGTGEGAGEEGSGGGGVKDVECGDWSARDYSGFPALQGVPRAGDRLAFKTLELSESYTPELSEFMEATVISVDQGSVKMRYTDEMMSRLAYKAATKSSGKFSLDVEDDGEDAENVSVDDLEQEIDITVSDMVEPKLLIQ